MKKARRATYIAGPAPMMMIAPRIQPRSAPESSTLRRKYPAMASTVLIAIHGQGTAGGWMCTIGSIPATASVAAAAMGTLMLSLMPSGHDSAIAATKVAMIATLNDGWPNSKTTAQAAAPPKSRNERKPPQLFELFHGRGPIGAA